MSTDDTGKRVDLAHVSGEWVASYDEHHGKGWTIAEALRNLALQLDHVDAIMRRLAKQKRESIGGDDAAVYKGTKVDASLVRGAIPFG